jgi:hypothetical protein
MVCTLIFTQWGYYSSWCKESGADPAAKISLLASSRPSDRPTLPLTMASVHPVLLNISWCVSVLIQTETDGWTNRIVGSSSATVFYCFASSNHMTHVGIGPSVHPMVPADFSLLHSVRSTPTHTPTLVPRYCRFIRRCLFPFLFISSSTCHCFNLTCHHLASKYILSPHFCYEHVNMSMVC